MMKRVAIFGAGALGGYVGGYLCAAGDCEVVLIDMWHEHIEAMRRDGLRLSGMSEEENLVAWPQTLHMHEIATELHRNPIDIAFIAVKSYDTEWVTQLVRPYLAPDGFVVSLQNCINEERIAEIVGWGRVLGCVASNIAVELVGPGEIRRQAQKGADGYTVFRVGEVHGRTTERATHLAQLLNGIDHAKVTSNLWGERWSKLAQNAMRNGLSAATGFSGPEMDMNGTIRGLSIIIGGEAVRIGKALGFNLEYVGKFEPDLIERAASGDAGGFEQLDSQILTQTTSGKRGKFQRSSMGQDVLKGRRTEIDYINGYVVEKGASVGIDAPANHFINMIVKEVEIGKIMPSIDNISGYG